MTETSIRRIPLAQPSIGERERELVARVLDSDILALGPFAVAFETRVAQIAGRRFGVACSSGTAGLHMAVQALGSGEGGEVVDWFVYVVRLDPAIDRGRLIADLDRVGVSSRPYFSPLHLQPVFRNAFGYRPGDFPVTGWVAASTFRLPFSARLPDEDVWYVVALVEAVEAQGHR